MMITIEAKSFQPQSRDFFDIYIESDINQNLLLASYRLKITPQAGNTANLDFRSSFDFLDQGNIDKQSNSEQNMSNYIFHGNTIDTNFSATRFASQEFIGSDSEATGVLGVTLLAHQKYLLARVEIFTENPGTGIFKVNLVNDNAQTIFLDSSATEIAINGSSFADATFSISSVPEPSSIVLGLIGSSLFGFYRWRGNLRGKLRKSE